MHVQSTNIVTITKIIIIKVDLCIETKTEVLYVAGLENSLQCIVDSEDKICICYSIVLMEQFPQRYIPLWHFLNDEILFMVRL